MEVVIDITKIDNLNSGLGQFCFHLVDHLAKSKSSFALSLFGADENVLTKKYNLKRRRLDLKEKITGNISFRPDVWHCTHQEPKFVPENVPYILTIHDLNFLYKYTSKWKVKRKLNKLQRLIDNASAITAVSEFTLNEIKSNFYLSEIPVKVIYNGKTLRDDIPPRKPDIKINQPFIFTIGIVLPKKNFISLIPFLKKINYTLLIAGDNTTTHAHEIVQLAKQEGVDKKLILTGPVSEEEKLWMYQNCEAFVFPSLSEGFGLPVVEAMSLGKPVFLSDKTSLPEIGGDAAFYWNNFETDHMTDVFNKNLVKYKSDKLLRSKIIEQSKKFSWELSVQRYLDLYHDLAGKKGKKH